MDYYHDYERCPTEEEETQKSLPPSATTTIRNNLNKSSSSNEQADSADDNHHDQDDEIVMTTELSPSPSPSPPTAAGGVLQPQILNDDIKLAIVFVSMVIVGTVVSVLNKLVAIPLYNYPNFLNVFGIIAYFLLCLICTVPIAIFGSSITQEQYQFPKRTFAIMAILDTISSSL